MDKMDKKQAEEILIKMAIESVTRSIANIEENIRNGHKIKSQELNLEYYKELLKSYNQ